MLEGGGGSVSVGCFPNYLQLLFQFDCTSDGWKWIHKIALKAASSESLGEKKSISSEINRSWRDLRALKNQIVGITRGMQNQDPHLLQVLTVFPFLPSSFSLCAEESCTVCQTSLEAMRKMLLLANVEKTWMNLPAWSILRSGVYTPIKLTWNWVHWLPRRCFGWLFCSGLTFALYLIKVIILLLLKRA